MTDIALRLKEQILGLPDEDRRELARLLWESLDSGPIHQEEESGAWLAELERRADDLAAGRATTEPMEKVFAELREEAMREKSGR
jgi:putative addiction module component (TIGR02574 family)